MPVCVIKNTEPRNISIPTTTLLGGATGLALRHFIPAQQEEIDTFLFNQSDSLKKDSTKLAIKEFMNDLKNKLRKDPTNKVLDMFIRSREAQGRDEVWGTRQGIKNNSKASKEFANELNKIKKDLLQKIKASRRLSMANIASVTKQARPVWAFLLPGAALGALSGYVYNVIGTIVED